jgi:hypothetical protein
MIYYYTPIYIAGSAAYYLHNDIITNIYAHSAQEAYYHGQRTQAVVRDSRIRSNELPTSKAESENSTNNIEIKSQEALDGATDAIRRHNWHHNRFDRWYICYLGESNMPRVTDCPGCGAIVAFDIVNKMATPSQSYLERLDKVDIIYWRQQNGR